MWTPSADALALEEAPPAAALVHDERNTRAADEGDHRVGTATELLVLGGRQQGLGGVGEPHAPLTEVSLAVGAVDVTVAPLEVFSRDEAVPHDTVFTLRGVVLVVDVRVAITPVITLVAELGDDVGGVHEHVLDDPRTTLIRNSQEDLEVLGVDVPAIDERPELLHLT